MKRYTKKGPRRSLAMPVSTKRFVVTDYDSCEYITAGKVYEVTYYGTRGEEIANDRANTIEIVTPLWPFGCSHIDGHKWRWATL